MEKELVIQRLWTLAICKQNNKQGDEEERGVELIGKEEKLCICGSDDAIDRDRRGGGNEIKGKRSTSHKRLAAPPLSVPQVPILFGERLVDLHFPCIALNGREIVEIKRDEPQPAAFDVGNKVGTEHGQRPS